MGYGASVTALPRLRRLWPLWLGLLGLLWLHRGGWWEGRVYALEDVMAYFFVVKSRLFRLAHGLEVWSWWDPLWQLGIPRLSTIQAGWLSPFSLWFALVPPLTAWRFYPLLIDSALLSTAYLAVRSMGASRAAAAWAAAIWTWSGSTLTTSQHPCFKESLLASCLCLAMSQFWWQRRQTRYLWGLALAGALHMGAGSPTAFYYDHLTLALVLPALAWRRCSLTVFVAGCFSYAAGLLLFSASWIAFQDYYSHGHRTLQLITGTGFAESFRLTPAECLRRLAGESYALAPPAGTYTQGYRLDVDLSLAASLLALSGLVVTRLRWLCLVSLLVQLQACGERGGLLWLLHQLAPSTLQVRAPAHFILLASLLYAGVAGLAWDHWRQSSAGWRRASNGLALWAYLFPLVALAPTLTGAYQDPAVFQPPPYPPVTGGRVAVVRDSTPHPFLLWESLPMAEGMPTLVVPDITYDQGYLLGLAYSQWGVGGRDRLGPTIRGARSVPLLRPSAPLLLSWGLTWILRGQEGSLGWQRLQPDPPRHWLCQPVRESAVNWASRSQGDPYAQAQIEAEVPPSPPVQAGLPRVELEQSDRQILQVEGPGLLVSADQWDPSWHCTVDGEPVECRRANLAQKSCWVPAGSHRLEWSYSVSWWPTFVGAHLLGWLVLLGCCRWARRRSFEERVSIESKGP